MEIVTVVTQNVPDSTLFGSAGTDAAAGATPPTGYTSGDSTGTAIASPTTIQNSLAQAQPALLASGTFGGANNVLANNAGLASGNSQMLAQDSQLASQLPPGAMRDAVLRNEQSQLNAEMIENGIAQNSPAWNTTSSATPNASNLFTSPPADYSPTSLAMGALQNALAEIEGFEVAQELQHFEQQVERQTEEAIVGSLVANALGAAANTVAYNTTAQLLQDFERVQLDELQETLDEAAGGAQGCSSDDDDSSDASDNDDPIQQLYRQAYNGMVAQTLLQAYSTFAKQAASVTASA